MYPVNFDSVEEIKKTISRTAMVLGFDTYRDVSRIYYDTLKLVHIKLKRKRTKSTNRERTSFTLSRKNISTAINVLTYFHSNDNYTKIKRGSNLAGCYHPTFSEDDACQYFEEFIEGIKKDKFGYEINFDMDFLKCLYKDEKGEHTLESEYYMPYRAKRLPLILDTVKNTQNTFKRFDEYDNIERMYINRYVDFFNNEYYYAVIVEKYRKDTQNPFVAKTAFPIFKYNGLLRRIEKYEPAT